MGERSNSLQALLDFLTGLERAKINFRLDRCREDTILVRVDVPGERWEVEFFANGEVEVERFGPTERGVGGGQEARQLLAELFEKHR
jgi:hypothetical protein